MPKPRRKRLLLDIHDVRERLPLSKSRIHQIINSGELPAVRVGKRVFVGDDVLEQFIAEHESRSA